MISTVKILDSNLHVPSHFALVYQPTRFVDENQMWLPMEVIHVSGVPPEKDEPFGLGMQKYLRLRNAQEALLKGKFKYVSTEKEPLLPFEEYRWLSNAKRTQYTKSNPTCSLYHFKAGKFGLSRHGVSEILTRVTASGCYHISNDLHVTLLGMTEEEQAMAVLALS